jgi:hypothetical protein
MQKRRRSCRAIGRTVCDEIVAEHESRKNARVIPSLAVVEVDPDDRRSLEIITAAASAVLKPAAL